tara:strand:+ start:327 stop:779 length:453 start_codon:yes stop_codon:yes gene_type:complete
MSQANEIISICMDITFPTDRCYIIQKYLLPRLTSGEIVFNDLTNELLSDVFNLLDTDDFEILQEQIQEIVGPIEAEDFVETGWKIRECSGCETLAPVRKCKGKHEEECPYSEMTSSKGCKNLFCDACLPYVCADSHPACSAIRCESCAEE